MPRNEVSIASLDDPRLDVYRDLNRTNLTVHSGRFVVEGKWLVERLLASDFPVESILVSRERLDQLPELIPDDVPVLIVPKGWVRQIVGFEFHRGMLACGRRRPPVPLEALAGPRHARRTLGVCLQTVDPTNLGGVIRNAAAFGLDGLLVGTGSSDPFSRRVIRVSMGASLVLPIGQATDDVAAMRALNERWGFELVATVLDPQAEPLERARRAQRAALVFGTEGHGLAGWQLEACQRRVTIPMQRGVDSLNLASASAVVFYHFTRCAPEEP